MLSSIGKIESLVNTIEELPDPQARDSAIALVKALMDFHGDALDRLMEIVAAKGDENHSLFADFAADENVSSLLLLYGLHPLPLETRVIQALDKVRPYLESHAGNVELLSVDQGVVRLRLTGSCKGCPSSAMTLKSAIEESIFVAAPDVVAIETEDQHLSSDGFVQIERPAAYTDCDFSAAEVATR